jgi:hypothetical protein
MLLNGLTLAEHGAQLFPAAIRAQLKDLLALLEALPSDQAGIGSTPGAQALGDCLGNQRCGWLSGLRAVIFAHSNWSSRTP